MPGLTQSPRAYWFGQVLPYRSRSLLCEQTQAFIQNINGSVMVSVMDCSTGWARPLPDFQIFGSVPFCMTNRAGLAGWEEPVYCDQHFSAPCCFVGELPPEFAPAYICDGTCHPMIFHHIAWSKVFDADDIIFLNQKGGQLMEHILPLICHLLMASCNLPACLLTAFTALCFSGQTALKPGKFLLAHCQMLIYL